MIDLTDRIALITGASRGIGKACALRLAEAGADVIVNYVSSKKAAMEVAQQILNMGRRAYVVKADVSKQEDVRSMLSFIGEKITDRLDILVSNAATGGFRPLLTATEKNFRAAFDTNVMALMYLVQSSLPLLERSEGRAKVVALSSHGSDTALPWYGLIGSSKAALESMARHFTLEIGERGVNINIVKSGLVETDSTRNIPNADRMFAARRDKSMMGDRMLTTGDVANAVLFLSSPLSDLVQGETLTIDGGVAVHI